MVASRNENNEEKMCEEYKNARSTYEVYGKNLEKLVESLCAAKGIEYLAIETRTKSEASFGSKIRRAEKAGKYKNLADVTDLAGIRIIAFYKHDAEKICNLIEENFLLDDANCSDKSAVLPPDRFGYLSTHYIVSHSEGRAKLPENGPFRGLKAEIQVRTVVQHAWAVLDRKLRYNQAEDIPPEVRRKLFRVSALLEIADDHLDEVHKTVMDLRQQYAKDIKIGKLEQDINLESLDVFLKEAKAVEAVIEAAKKYGFKVADPLEVPSPVQISRSSDLGAAARIAEIHTIKALNARIVAFIKNSSKAFEGLPSDGQKFSIPGMVRLALVLSVDKATATQIITANPFSNPELQLALRKRLNQK